MFRSTFFDPLFDDAELLQHFEGVAHHVDLGIAVVDDLYRHFHDAVPQLLGPENGFEVKGKALGLGAGEDLLRRLAAVGLAAALGP